MMTLDDLVKKYKADCQEFAGVVANVAIHALSKNIDALEAIKKQAEELADRADQLKDIAQDKAPGDPTTPGFVKGMEDQVAIFNKVVKGIDDAILLSKHGQQMNDNGNN